MCLVGLFICICALLKQYKKNFLRKMCRVQTVVIHFGGFYLVVFGWEEINENICEHGDKLFSCVWADERRLNSVLRNDFIKLFCFPFLDWNMPLMLKPWEYVGDIDSGHAHWVFSPFLLRFGWCWKFYCLVPWFPGLMTYKIFMLIAWKLLQFLKRYILYIAKNYPSILSTPSYIYIYIGCWLQNLWEKTASLLEQCY